MAITNHPLNADIRRAKAQLDGFLDRDPAYVARPERIEAGLLTLGRVAVWLGGRIERQWRAQTERYFEHDLNAKTERAEAVFTLMERAIYQAESRLALFN